MVGLMLKTGRNGDEKTKQKTGGTDEKEWENDNEWKHYESQERNGITYIVYLK